jgi:putative DNA primase/helicase
MVPDPSWFSDSMPHDLASKDARAHLRGKWFIELPELAQFKRTELAALKGFLTTATDTYRPSYGRHEVTVARQCVFVASTNEDEYLADATGGRRYWPVALGGEVDLAGIRRDRDQLWAEAAEAFGRGEAWWITDKALLPAVERVQASRKVGDGWDQIVADYVATKGVNAIVAEDFLMDVIKLDPAVLHVSHLRRIGEIMRGMGWTRQAVRQEDGRQRKGWVRPIVLRGVANDGVADARGRDDDLIERDDAPRKRDHLKVVRPQLRPGEA